MPAIISLFIWVSSDLSCHSILSKPVFLGPNRCQFSLPDHPQIGVRILIIDLIMRLCYLAARNSIPILPLWIRFYRSPHAEGVAMKIRALLGVALAILLLVSITSSVGARQQSQEQSEPVAKRSDIYCTGFIADSSPRAEIG